MKVQMSSSQQNGSVWVILLAAVCSVQAYYPQVQTNKGLLTGISLPEAHAFYSVPYAKPPVGNLRFGPSRPVDFFNDFNASSINNVGCVQESSVLCGDYCATDVSEDCLLLNVHVPLHVDLSNSTTPPNGRLPVMLYIPGGAFTTSAGTLPPFDGRYLSEIANVVIVSINYRLGSFGFFVYDDGNDVINGNQGIGDQQLALNWVQENIDKFGGDKQKVTIFGQSAGAQSVLLHLMSEKSSPLFQRAIMQSNPAYFKYKSKQEAMQVTDMLLNLTNCQNLTCLRDLSASKLLEANSAVVDALQAEDQLVWFEPFSPVIDGEEFTQGPFEYFQQGKWERSKKNLIFGTNVDEMFGAAFLFSPGVPVNNDTFQQVLTSLFGYPIGKEVADEYRMTYPADDVKTMMDKVMTDGMFICPTRALARLTSASMTSDIFLYSFAHAMDDRSCVPIYFTYCDAVFHGSELPFVFRTGSLINYNFNDNDMESVDQFSNYWGNFAHSGNPSSGDVGLGNSSVEWPSYEATSQAIRQFPASLGNLVSRVGAVDPWINVVIDSPSGITQLDYKKDICDFWDSTGYYLTLSDNTTSAAPSNTTHVPSGNTDKPNVAMTTQPTEEEMTTTGSAIRPQIALVTMITSLLASLMYMPI
ncbi:unnamed protein product [Clavelina lepadiformis]|uniref:Carboxylic ester hydrolase n=1 Tax=Clavelina lepadiformis TaxID=159417 RepID=A0ABP0FR68_CLALP